MNKHGIQIHTGGGETADIGDLVKTIVVDSTMAVRMKRAEVIENNIQVGDVVVSFASFGQSTYESAYNSGIGSNGLTSARHDVFSKNYIKQFPETFDHLMPKDLAYSGSLKVTSQPLDFPLDAGRMVLSPTRTYAPMLFQIYKHFRKNIKGVIHCSGGGQAKALKFIGNVRVVKDNLFELPPLFRWLKDFSGASLKELYTVFNMGQRMEIYTDMKSAEEMIKIANSFNIEAQISGYVIDDTKPTVEIKLPKEKAIIYQ